MKFKSIWALVGVVVASSLAVLSVFAEETGEDDYDRLDGHGKSLVKVDVIEWEGNLELHLYPKGRLKGLGFKIDRTKKDKPVMVISYRFVPPAGRAIAGEDKPLIRRAILGISLRDDFKAFRDPSVPDYDKIILTNSTLASPLIAFQADPAPSQLYPDGHPMNDGGGRSVASPSGGGKLDFSNPETRDALKKVDGLNPELREVPKSGVTTHTSESERSPAAQQPSKFHNQKLDENTSGAVKVKELDLNQGFNW